MIEYSADKPFVVTFDVDGSLRSVREGYDIDGSAPAGHWTMQVFAHDAEKAKDVAYTIACEDAQDRFAYGA